MIDLGTDLAGYGDDESPKPVVRPPQPQPRGLRDGGMAVPLADLQAAGFNHTNPYQPDIDHANKILKWLDDVHPRKGFTLDMTAMDEQHD